jgi:hypothetical protein
MRYHAVAPGRQELWSVPVVHASTVPLRRGSWVEAPEYPGAALVAVAVVDQSCIGLFQADQAAVDGSSRLTFKTKTITAASSSRWR